MDTGDSDKGSRPRSRDEHLRSADFFNAAEFPKMTYKSTKRRLRRRQSDGDRGQPDAAGRHEAGGAHARAFQVQPGVGHGKERCGGDVTGKVKRSEFGMKRGVPAIGDEVMLTIGFEGNKD